MKNIGKELIGNKQINIRLEKLKDTGISQRNEPKPKIKYLNPFAFPNKRTFGSRPGNFKSTIEKYFTLG